MFSVIYEIINYLKISVCLFLSLVALGSVTTSGWINDFCTIVTQRKIQLFMVKPKIIKNPGWALVLGVLGTWNITLLAGKEPDLTCEGE